MTNLKNEIPVSININGQSFLIDLDDEPLVLGRDVEDLPSLVMNIFRNDNQISGKHCQIWYAKADNNLHITSFSANNTRVNGELLGKGKEKTLAIQAKFDLEIGQTKIHLVRQDSDKEKTPLSLGKTNPPQKPLVIDIPAVETEVVKVQKGNSIDVSAPLSKKTFMASLFSMEGRCSRLQYLKMVAGFIGVALMMLLLIVGTVTVCEENPDLEEVASVVLGFIIIAGYIVAGVVNAFYIVKRLHDLGRSGWHYWFLLIPIYSIYIAIILLAKKGDEGQNEYGPDPLAEKNV